VQRLEAFLSGTLPGRLAADLRHLRMVREADLECCAYYHLRRFLRRDDRWRLFARKYSRYTGHFVDLLAFRRDAPRVAIELKWNRARISNKDRRSLRLGIRKLRINRAYFITTLIGARSYRETAKTTGEKYRLFERPVRLPLSGVDLAQWQERRRHFTVARRRRRRIAR
jgi:hypothetical protein